LSGLFVDNQQLIIPSAVVIGGFLGSVHCAGMCGPLIMSFARDRKSLLGYHSARLLAYSLAGAASGAFGHVLISYAPKWLIGVALTLFAVLLLASGWRLLGFKSLHYSLPQFPFLASLQTQALRLRKTFPLRSAALLGFLSVFLPCGHLYVFLAAAASTGHAFRGASLMALFAVSTWPALGFGVALLQHALAPAARLRLAGAILILAGLASFASFVVPWSERALTPAHQTEIAAPRCH